MLTVRDVMTERVIALAPQMTLREAAELLTRHNVSGAPVMDGPRVVGTLAATDLLAFESSMPGVPVGYGESDAPIDSGNELMDDLGGPPGAYFTEMWDDAGVDADQRFSTIEGPEWDVLGEHTVEEAMSTEVLWFAPDAPLQLAAEEIGRTGTHRVLVEEGGIVVGIVTTMDITRAVARANPSEEALT